MADVKLDIAFWEYDRTRALADGTVKIEGVAATYHSAPIVTEIFEGMIGEQKYGISELGMTYFLRTFHNGESPFVAIPVFPNRAFRHSGIYINKQSGIRTPHDLNGKTIGELALYSHDAGIMAKGMLSDEFGFRPETCRWLISGLDWPLKPIEFVPHTHPREVQVTDVPREKELGAMLESGEIDALISADIPRCILEDSPKVTRLFPDYKQVERDYYRRTGIFPIMHTVVIRKDLLAKHPELAKRAYQGFCEAKKAAVEKIQHGLIFNSMGTMIPWLNDLVDTDRAVLGDDWWPYGIGANRKAIDAILRYHFEQGITPKQFTCDEIFVPELMGS